jgi:hypothetical protein
MCAQINPQTAEIQMIPLRPERVFAPLRLVAKTFPIHRQGPARSFALLIILPSTLLLSAVTVRTSVPALQHSNVTTIAILSDRRLFAGTEN